MEESMSLASYSLFFAVAPTQPEPYVNLVTEWFCATIDSRQFHEQTQTCPARATVLFVLRNNNNLIQRLYFGCGIGTPRFVCVGRRRAYLATERGAFKHDAIIPLKAPIVYDVSHHAILCCSVRSIC